MSSNAAQSPNPPSYNMGGVNPASPSNPSLTIVDWFSFTFVEKGEWADKHAVRKTILDLVPQTVFGEPEPGSNGYPNQMKILHGSVIVGWVAYGAATHDRAWVTLTGEAMRIRRAAGIEDNQLVEGFSSFNEARYSRVDIAADFFENEVCPDMAKAAYEFGAFDNPPSNVRPKARMFESTTYKPGVMAKTLNIGLRKSGKTLRVYQKGYQLLDQKSPDELRHAVYLGLIKSPSVDFEKLEGWTRVELELKHDKQKPIPEDVIPNRDNYFAGSYPWVQNLMPMIKGIKPDYIPKENEVELAHLVASLKRSYGGVIYHLADEAGVSPEKIIEMIKGDKRAARIAVHKENEA